MKTKKESKFNLEKFEVAKLSNLKSIKGGDTGDPLTTTQTSKRCNDPSTDVCFNPETKNP